MQGRDERLILLSIDVIYSLPLIDGLSNNNGNNDERNTRGKWIIIDSVLSL